MKSCAAFTVAVLVASLISCQQGRAQSPEFQEALTLAQSKQQDAEDTELKRDAEFKRAASEIASARIHQALHQHWNDQDGFSLSPMDLQYVVSKFDTERIKKLDEEHSTIWKSVDPIFADHYCQLQAPVNDKHLKHLEAVRRLITESINEAVYADHRYGGFTIIRHIRVGQVGISVIHDCINDENPWEQRDCHSATWGDIFGNRWPSVGRGVRWLITRQFRCLIM